MTGNANGASVPAKRPLHETKPKRATYRQSKKLRKRDAAEGPTTDDVLDAELAALVRELALTEDDIQPRAPLQAEVDVRITHLSPTGDGVGRRADDPSEIFVVPFAVPGDVVRAKPYRHVDGGPLAHTLADFVRTVEASPDRDDARVRCRYFARCAGCQFQMLDYARQLEYKRGVVRKAFANFSGLPPTLVPPVGEVRGSPLQYAYRTKLSTHFDGPRRGGRRANGSKQPRFEEVPPIGFMRRGTRSTMDIEECPVGADVLQLGMRRERQRVVDNLATFSRGATILLRESTRRQAREELAQDIMVPSTNEATQTIYEERDGTHVDVKTCVSDEKGTCTEYIGPFEFSNPAGSFFQNNNSILPKFTDYIREQVSTPRHANLIDAYCGSGLFTITLASLFERTIGIDIDARSILTAEANLKRNITALPRAASRSPSPYARTRASPGLSGNDLAKKSSVPNSKGVHFIAADAAQLFASVKDFAADQTAVILDPPRKGCDTNFLRQLLDFAPARIVYVSCNVHTQARDIGWLLRRGREATDKDEDEPVDDPPYRIDSLVGFDFFPQTSHVEGVAVLTRVAAKSVTDKISESIEAASDPPTGRSR